MTNPLPEAVAAGRFSYIVELVSSAKRPERILEFSSGIVSIPGVTAGSVTSYPGGSSRGDDPVQVAAAVRERGLTPNVHLTCVYQDRHELRRSLDALRANDIPNVFAITGDYPKGGHTQPVFDVDSVQLIELVARVRKAEKYPFHISVAVSPFKYVREDLLYQYLKLEKKIAAGADMAITQLGWDVRKFLELKRYLDEHGLKIPIVGGVYVLDLRAAKKMSKGEPPGCWAPPALVEQVEKESQAPDAGLEARLERGARTAAVLKGIGYAGAYIGGVHNPEHVGILIRRAEELAPRWEELVGELQYGDPNGFYLYEGAHPPKPKAGLLPVLLDAMGKTLPVPWAKAPRETWLRSQIRSLMAWADRHGLNHTVENLELVVKKPVFGCLECGNCVLGHMEYVCPQTCPKQMRNGPCGGTFHGKCEVVDKPCIWVKVMERAEASDNLTGLKTFIPAPDRTLTGTSSWVNFYLGRDSRPGNPAPDSSGAETPAAPVSPIARTP